MLKKALVPITMIFLSSACAPPADAGSGTPSKSTTTITVTEAAAAKTKAEAPAEPLPAAVAVPGAVAYPFTPKGLETGLTLYVSRPEGPPPPQGYPVLYVFDADLSFIPLTGIARLTALSARRARLTPPLIVGIGYMDPADFKTRRTYDLTPPADRYDLPERPNGRPWPKLGGGEAFAKVLINEIKPFVAARYQIDPDNETLAGHSLGGLLTLHILLTRPEAFDRYVAASPSLWFNGRATMTALMARQEEGPSKGSGGGQRKIPLRLSVGGHEEKISSWALKSGMSAKDRQAWLDANQMVTNASELASHLKKVDGFVDVSFEVYSGLEHMPASLPALYHAVQFAADPDVFKAGGADSGKD